MLDILLENNTSAVIEEKALTVARIRSKFHLYPIRTVIIITNYFVFYDAHFLLAINICPGKFQGALSRLLPF